MLRIVKLFGSLLVLTLSTTTGAQVTGFVNDPTGNSVDWTGYVTSFGAAIDTHVNFDSHPVGALQSSFYLVSDGVTLTGTNGYNTVDPWTGYTTGWLNPPLSTGEGLYPGSNHLDNQSNFNTPSSLTVSFAHPVVGAGLFVDDLYNVGGAHPVTLSAFSGANGTGTLLGTYSAAEYNFQDYYTYFMGIASSSASPNIGSIIFNDPGNNTGDGIIVDDVRFTYATTPEPGTYGLFAGFACAATWSIKRRRRS